MKCVKEMSKNIHNKYPRITHMKIVSEIKIKVSRQNSLDTFLIRKIKMKNKEMKHFM